MRLFGILGLYVKRYFLQWMAWRSFAFTLVTNQAVTPLIGLAVWSTALPDQNHISLYYIIILAVRLMTVSYENHTFSNRIYSGDIAEDLLRPHPIFLQPLGENISIRIWHIIIGAPMLFIVCLFVPIEINLINILIALPAVLLAGMMQFLFTFALAVTAFWTERAHGVVNLGSTFIFLLGGIAVPIYLMPYGLEQIVSVLPFRFMIAFPAEIIVDQLNYSQIMRGFLYQLIWVIVLMGVSYFAWKKGLRRYTVVGG